MDAKTFAMLQKSIWSNLLILKVLTRITLEGAMGGNGEVGGLGTVPPQPRSVMPC